MHRRMEKVQKDELRSRGKKDRTFAGDGDEEVLHYRGANGINMLVEPKEVTMLKVGDLYESRDASRKVASGVRAS